LAATKVICNFLATPIPGFWHVGSHRIAHSPAKECRPKSKAIKSQLVRPVYGWLACPMTLLGGGVISPDPRQIAFASGGVFNSKAIRGNLGVSNGRYRLR
jgi:hypothetical protein